MVVFFLALIALVINSSSYFSLIGFSATGAGLAISMLIYGVYTYKEKKYESLFKADTKTDADSIKPSISIIVVSIALLFFLYSFYSKEVLHLRMQALLHEAKGFQEDQK